MRMKLLLLFAVVAVASAAVRPVIPNSFTAKVSERSLLKIMEAEVKLDAPNKRASVKYIVMGLTMSGMIARQGKKYSHFADRCDVTDMTSEEMDVFDYQKHLPMATFDKTEVIDRVTLFKWDVVGKASFWCDDEGVVRQVAMMGRVLKVSEIVETASNAADFDIRDEWNCAGMIPPVLPNSFTAKTSAYDLATKISTSSNIKVDGPNKRASISLTIRTGMDYMFLHMISKKGKLYSYDENRYQCEAKNMTSEKMDLFDFQKRLSMATLDKNAALIILGVRLYKWDVKGIGSVWCDRYGAVGRVDPGLYSRHASVFDIAEATFTDADFEVPDGWGCPVPVPERVRPVLPNSFTAKASGQSQGVVMQVTLDIKMDGPNKRASTTATVRGMTLAMIGKQGKNYIFNVDYCEVKNMTPEEMVMFDFQKYLLDATFDKIESGLYKWDVKDKASFWCDRSGVLKRFFFNGQMITVSQIVETTFTDADFEVPAAWNCRVANALSLRRPELKATPVFGAFGLAI